MLSVRHPLRRMIGIPLLIGMLLTGALWGTPPPPSSPAPPLRWAEGAPGCTFSQSDDGRYRYGLWADDFGVTLAVDAQELEKARRRVESFFAVFLSARYRGKDSLDLRREDVGLEFVKHYHEVQSSMDPAELASRLQNDATALTAKAQREMQAHPEKKNEAEAVLHELQKDIAGMLEFLPKNSLRTVTLTPDSPEATGWVFFDTKSKWIGDWKKQEDFVLRVPLGKRVVEFPFTLPPSQGDFILRRRPEN